MKTATRKPHTATTFIYSFDEPTHGGRELLGGKGLRALGDGAPRRARPRRLHDHDRRLPCLHGSRRRAPSRSRGRDRGARRQARACDRCGLRRSLQPAARLGSLGRGDLDAGHDGHDPRPRSQRRDDERAGRSDRQRAVRLRLVPTADPDVRRGRRGSRRASLRARADRAQGRVRRRRRRRADRARPAAADRALPADLRGRGGPAVPARRARAAAARGARGLRLVELGARPRVPPDLRDPGRARDCRERDADGVREQGRRLRDRRLLQPRPLDRRARSLRRVPGQRSGGGRRRGHPAAPHARRHARPVPGRVRPSWSRRSIGSSATIATCRTSSSLSSRGACTCSRPDLRSGRPLLLFAPPWRWSRRGCWTATTRSRASTRRRSSTCCIR